MTRCLQARPQNSREENTQLLKTWASGPIRSRNFCNCVSNNQEAARTGGRDGTEGKGYEEEGVL